MMSLRHQSGMRSARRNTTSLLISILISLLMATQAQANNGHHKLKSVDKGGVVYAMTNDAGGNEIVVFQRKPNGKLRLIQQATASTGGLGGSDNAAIDPLGSQNALVFDDESKMLFAVNAGDNTVTAFTTHYGGFLLHKSAQEPSGGYIPVSVAASEGLLYVLNAGGSGSVATFAIGYHGELLSLGELDLGLSNDTSIPFNNVMAPGQVGVDALKRRVIVTNAGGQELLTAALDDNGIPVGSVTETADPGIVPFAFGVSGYGNVLVAEAGSGSVSSFSPSATGQPLVLATSSVGTGQAATCWIVVTDDYAYTANTGSNTISLFSHARTGALTLLDATAATASGAPTDMTLAGGGKYLYTLDSASGNISGFAIDPNSGELHGVETQSGLPASAGIQGIAAYDY